MRDKRAIIIKGSRLQKVRNNLRNLLLKAVSIKWNELFDEMEKISRDDKGKIKSVRYMTPDKKKRFRALQEEQARLRKVADKSICKCIACGRADRDMVYNKAYRAWYCTECYEMEHAYAQELQSESKPKPQGHEEKTIEDHSKTFL